MTFKTKAELKTYLDKLKTPQSSKYWDTYVAWDSTIGPDGFSDDEAMAEISHETARQEAVESRDKSEYSAEPASEDENAPVPESETEKGYYDTTGDYKWAKDSEIKNVGEEIDGAARHNRNKDRDWESIEEMVAARKESLSRKDLEEMTPNKLKDRVSETDDSFNNEFLLCQLMMLQFPQKTPGEEFSDEYAALYGEIKAMADSSLNANSSEKAGEAMYKNLTRKLLTTVTHIRHQNGGRDNAFSEQLRLYYNRILKGKNTSAYAISRDVDLQTIEEYLSEFPDDQKQQIAYTIRMMNRGVQTNPPEEIQEALGGLTKAISEGKKEFIKSGKPRVVKKRESSPGDRKNVKEQDFYKDFTPGREASSEIFHDHKDAVEFMDKKVQFRSIEFGNSMPDSERAIHLKAAATALSDLSGALGISHDKISFGRKLALAFGSRGSRGALATYITNGSDKIINITRNNGYGSLAHEWGHALSDNIGRNGHGIRGVTDAESLAPEFRPQQYIQDIRSSIRKSGIVERIRQNDHFRKEMTFRSQSYWLESEELYARFFECYVERKLKHNGIKNTYLTGGSRAYLWPTEVELDALEPQFDKLIESIGGSPAKLAKKAG